jgi:predicted DNA-binding transcriptional regulator AlpA
MDRNDLLMGWKQIAAFLGVSERSIRGYRGPLLEDGRIFYRRRRLGKKYVCAWQDDIRQWAKSR